MRGVGGGCLLGVGAAANVTSLLCCGGGLPGDMGRCRLNKMSDCWQRVSKIFI